MDEQSIKDTYTGLRFEQTWNYDRLRQLQQYDSWRVFLDGKEIAYTDGMESVEQAQKVLLLALLMKYPDVALQAIMTTSEAEGEFDLKRSTAMKAAQRGTVDARRTDTGTWLITRASAERQWDALRTSIPGTKHALAK